MKPIKQLIHKYQNDVESLRQIEKLYLCIRSHMMIIWNSKSVIGFLGHSQHVHPVFSSPSISATRDTRSSCGSLYCCHRFLVLILSDNLVPQAAALGCRVHFPFLSIIAIVPLNQSNLHSTGSRTSAHAAHFHARCKYFVWFHSPVQLLTTRVAVVVIMVVGPCTMTGDSRFYDF